MRNSTFVRIIRVNPRDSRAIHSPEFFRAVAAFAS